MMDGPTPKRRRCTEACDFCHRRGLKCKPSLPSSTPSSRDDQVSSTRRCLTCVEHEQDCTTSRISRKRGTKSNSKKGESRSERTLATPSAEEDDSSMGSSPCFRYISQDMRDDGFKIRRHITFMIYVYLDSIHLMYGTTLFHKPRAIQCLI